MPNHPVMPWQYYLQRFEGRRRAMYARLWTGYLLLFTFFPFTLFCKIGQYKWIRSILCHFDFPQLLIVPKWGVVLMLFYFVFLIEQTVPGNEWTLVHGLYLEHTKNQNFWFTSESGSLVCICINFVGVGGGANAWVDHIPRENMTHIWYLLFKLCMQTNKETEVSTIPTALSFGDKSSIKWNKGMKVSIHFTRTTSVLFVRYKLLYNLQKFGI